MTNPTAAITQAVRRNDAAALERLVAEHGTGVLEASGLTSGTALEKAIARRADAALLACLRLGADPNAAYPTHGRRTTPPAETPLLHACESGYLFGAQALLEHGAAPDLIPPSGAVPALCLAARHGAARILETLLAHGAEIDIEDPYGQTALLIAAEEGSLPAVQMLLAHGANPGTTPTACLGYGYPLLAACQSRRPSTAIVRALLAHGAPVSRGGILGETPLHAACRLGRSGTVRLLLEFGADPCRGNADGETPLHLVGERDDGHLFRLLMRHGADPLLRDAAGRRPHPPGARAAEEPPAPPTYPAALTRAISRGDVPGIERLVQRHGSEVLLVRRADGMDALDLAVSNAPASSLSACLRLCPEGLERVDPEGSTPLRFCAGHRLAVSARILLEHGAEPDRPGWNGETALHVACAAGDTTLVALLLEHGASPQVRDDHQITPEQSADLAGHNDVIDLFRSLARRTALPIPHGHRGPPADPAPGDGPFL